MKTQAVLQSNSHCHIWRSLGRCIVVWLLVIPGLGLLLCAPRFAYAQDPVPLDTSAAWLSDVLDYTYHVAWGDVDGDGDLDLAVGNTGKNRVYLNQGGVLQTTAAWLSDDEDPTRSVAWGDVDGDGDLDLAAGNIGPNRVYLNQGGVLQTTATPFSSDEDQTQSVAWGDMNGDGYLDLAVGNGGQANKVYLNQGGGLAATAAWSSADPLDDTWSVAWGDMDGDGNLDLAVGNDGEVNRVYLNQGVILATAAVWTSTLDQDATQSVAWGDVDGDGYLDLAVGNNGLSNKVYLNLGGVLKTTADWTSFDTDKNTQSVAWGDADGDGDLDLAAGNNNKRNTIYLNLGGSLQTAADWISDSPQDNTRSVAWGDVDGDGDLDLAAGNSGQPSKIYLNQGRGLQTTADWLSYDTYMTWSVAWGDVNEDGNLDLAAGNSGQPNAIYQNLGEVLHTTAVWTSTLTNPTYSVAWGDVDGNDSLDLAAGNTSENRVYLNQDSNFQLTDVWTFTLPNDTARSVAWGDVDGDNDLDLAVGNKMGPNKVYLNLGTSLTTTGAWVSDDTDTTQSVAWGDVDGDGDLDLAAGNDGPNKVYLNQDGILRTTAAWSSDGAGDTRSVAWGDVDGDGDLDLAAGNYEGPNKIYLNQNGVLQTTAAWSSNSPDATYSVAWGDMDGDGDLDLAAGNYEQQNKIYLNLGASLQSTAVWFSDSGDRTRNVAWGDVNGDGDLDLAAGNYNQQNKIYLNGRQGTQTLPNNGPALKITTPFTTARANFYASPRVLVNRKIPFTYTLFDPEGDTVGWVEALFSLDGGDNWQPAVPTNTVTTHLTAGPYPTPTITNTHVFTWDTFASDVFGQSDNVVFRLVAYPQPPASTTTGTYHYYHSTPASYQRPYASATTFPFRVQGTQVQVFSATQPISNAMVYHLPAEQPTGGSPLADNSGTPFRTDHRGYLQGRGEIGLGDRLFAMMPVHTATNYEGVLVFDGEDDYTIVTPLDNAPITATTVSFWISSTQTTGGTPFSYASPVTDSTLLITNPDGFVIYRGNGVSVTTPVTVTDGAWHHIAVTWHSADGQVRLYKDGLAAFTDTLTTAQMSTGGSLVLGKDQNGGGFFAGSLDEVRLWNIVLTETQILDDMYGLLGENEPGLVAYWPFDDPENPARDRSGNSNDGTLYGTTWLGDYIGGYTVYHTSGEPNTTGMTATTVTEPGVQVLTVTAQHPLILFDIDVSLEWDASNDLNDYLGQLEIDLKRASKHLYDFTNGQVALGQVTVYQNGDNWIYSHLAVHATNRLRPFAAQGGIVLTATVDPDHDDIIYGPGQVHMGATWNRYGTPGQNQGVDWPLILAHELGHYFLYLDDVYLGLNEDGLLIPVRTCTGSAMGDVYNPDNTEFISDTLHWTNYCTDTLAAKTLERTEWETIRLWYPWLVTPVITNTGPNRMPFNFTTVTILDPITPTDGLIDPTFYLDYQGGAVSSSGARAFLLRDGDADPPSELNADDFEYVYDLGSPIGGQNRVQARGAQTGDRLCIFDRPRTQYGCEIIQDGDEQVQLERDESWTPVIQLSPVNSTTFGIQVGRLSTDTLNLKARLYPEYGSAFTVTTLSYVSATESYSGTLHLAYLSMVGQVQLWVDEGTEPTETDPRPESIVVFAIGGNPGHTRGGGGHTRGGGGHTRGGGGHTRGGGGHTRGGGGHTRGGGAPLLSPDGQMIFFTENPIVFNEGEFFTIQTMAGLPPLPPGRTLVGQGYNMVASSNFTREITGSISIQYLGSDVLAAGANEDDLTLYYYWDGDWTELDTVLDTYFNMASAPSEGTGVYALMASVKIPLYSSGWNLVSYPVRETQAITKALRSIEGKYAIVYGHVVTDTDDPWRVYGVDAPAHVNRLHELRFGRGYWISATEAVTWYIGVESEALAASDVQNMPSPPATYYGSVLAGQGITPTTGMAVTAWVKGNPCGQGRTLEVGGEIVYSIHVFADGPGGAAGCGEPGERVTFRVGGQAMAPAATWNNHRLWELTLQPAQRVYLPLILRH